MESKDAKRIRLLEQELARLKNEHKQDRAKAWQEVEELAPRVLYALVLGWMGVVGVILVALAKTC